MYMTYFVELFVFFFFSSRRRHTRFDCDWSSDVCSSDLEDETALTVLDRLWHLNPLLTKTVLDLVAQRTYHKDEIYKHLASSAFKGSLPSRPALETWLQVWLSTGLLRTLGIAVTVGPRAEKYVALAAAFDT